MGVKLVGGCVAAAMLAGAWTAPAMAQQPDGDWRQVYEQPQGPIFIDRGSVRREGNFVTLRSRANLIEALEDGTQTMFVRFRFDCSARTYDILGLHFVRADGATIAEQEIPADQRQVEPIAPDSANAAIAAEVCR
jgi:hypothetical protein